MNGSIIDILKLILVGVLFFIGAILSLACIIWGMTVGANAAGLDTPTLTSYFAAVFKSLKVVLAIGVPGAMIYTGVQLLK